MEPALVSQDGSWHQNMLRKWLDKNNRIRPGVFEEVCWRLIKDSDLCSLHQKKQILCFLKNGTWKPGSDVQYTREQAQNKYLGVNIKEEMKNSTSLAASCDIFGNQFKLLNKFVCPCILTVRLWQRCCTPAVWSEALCRYSSWFVY